MEIKMTKARQFLFLAAVFLSTVIIMGDFIIMPTVNTLYGLYPNDELLVNFVVTGNYLVVIVASLVAGKLCAKVSKKNLLVIGAVAGLIGGGCMMFANSALLLAILRGIFGVAYAFTQVSAIAILADVYTDETKRGQIVGFYNAFSTVVGAVLSIVAGNLATVSIGSAYASYWIIAVYFVLLILFVPNIKPNQLSADVEEADVLASEATAKKSGMSKNFWLTLLALALYSFGYAVTTFFVSVYVAENGLGNEALSGYYSTVITVAGFFAGIAFGMLFKRLSQYIAVIAYTVFAAAVVLLYFFPSMVLAFICYGCIGACVTTIMSFAFSALPSYVPQGRTGDAVAYYISLSSVITFCSSYFVTGLQSAMGTDRVTDLFPILVVLLVAAALIQIVVARSKGKGRSAGSEDSKDVEAA